VAGNRLKGGRGGISGEVVPGRDGSKEEAKNLEAHPKRNWRRTEVQKPCRACPTAATWNTKEE